MGGMSMDRVLADKRADKDAWLAARERVVTASEIPHIVRGGAGRASILAEKRAGVRRDLSGIPAIAHGLAREEVIARWAIARWPSLAVDERLIHAPGQERHAATCDLTGPGVIVEIKTGVHDWSKAPAGRYVDQVLWQMYCLDVRTAHIIYEQHEDGVPLAFEPLVIPVDWDEARVGELVAAADAFLAELDDPTVEPVAVDVDLDTVAVAYLDAHEAEKARTATKKARWGELQALLADRGSGSQETTHARVTWSTVTETKTTVDEQGAREANPELAGMWDALLAAHTTTETVEKRRQTVTRPKETP